jgi:hypothetical protein
MEISGQLHAPAALLLGKEPLVLTEQEAQLLIISLGIIYVYISLSLKSRDGSVGIATRLLAGQSRFYSSVKLCFRSVRKLFLEQNEKIVTEYLKLQTK